MTDLTKLSDEQKQMFLNWAAARAELGKMTLQEMANNTQAIVLLSQPPTPEPEEKDDPPDKAE